MNTVDILMRIMQKYGLTDVKLVHSKSGPVAEFKGEPEITLLSRTEISGSPLAVDFLSSPSILMVYEHESLGVFIVVHVPKEPDNLEAYPMIWTPATGEEGDYLLAQESANKDKAGFKQLHDRLAAKGGKLTIGGMFVWLFPDGTAIGSKPAKLVRRKEPTGESQPGGPPP